jgi:hypothetical protein
MSHLNSPVAFRNVTETKAADFIVIVCLKILDSYNILIYSYCQELMKSIRNNGS